MNEHVLTTMTSASSALRRKFCPGPRQKSHHHFTVDQILRASQANEADFCRSNLCRVFRPEAVVFSLESGIVRFFEGMESYYFNIFRAAKALSRLNRMFPCDFGHHGRQYPED